MLKKGGDCSPIEVFYTAGGRGDDSYWKNIEMPHSRSSSVTRMIQIDKRKRNNEKQSTDS